MVLLEDRILLPPVVIEDFKAGGQVRLVIFLIGEGFLSSRKEKDEVEEE